MVVENEILYTVGSICFALDWDFQTVKFQLSKFEDLICFLKGFVNLAKSHQTTGRALHIGAAHMEAFYKEKGRARELFF